MDHISPSRVDTLRRLEARARREGCSVDELVDRLLHTDHTELEQKFTVLDRFFTIALDLLCIADTDGNFIKVNTAWEHILGYPVEALEGRPFLDFVHPDDHTATLDMLSQLVQQKPIFNFTNRYRAHDGSYRYIEWRAQPHGQLIYAAARDITEHKYMEDTLRQREQDFRTLAENSPDNIQRMDREGVHLYVNPAFARSLGMPVEQIIGKTTADFDVPEPFLQLVYEMRERVYASGEPAEFDFTYPVNGSEIHYNTQLIPEFDTDGRIYSLLAVSRDVTARKQAEDALRESERRMRLMLEAMPDLILLNRADGTYLAYYTNDTNRLHAPPEQFLGKTLYDVFPPAIADHKLQMIRQALHTGQTTFYEFEFDDHTYEVHVVPLGPDEAMSMARDVTEQRQAQQRQIDLILEQERRHLLSAFIQNAAHEFRTPLTTISTSTYLMARTDDPDRRQTRAERVQSEVERITRLVDMLLMAARLDSSDTIIDSDVHIGEIITSLTHFMKDCDLDFQVPDNLPPVAGNHDYLAEALKQIIDNAYRFSPPDSRIAIHAGTSDHSVWVRVSDSGPGIAEDALKHIFDTFWREDDARTTPGLGLGLSIAYKIIEAHGGTIQVESALGQGSTFTVSLPGNKL